MSHLECNNQNYHTPSAKYSDSNHGEGGYVLSEEGFLLSPGILQLWYGSSIVTNIIITLSMVYLVLIYG